ncbi:MAG: YihY/virulence factor BrkB family protein [Tissierellia bacterium]|nr:YihY/virulence factor BrkB family protein [Tissierellia bacterium]
MTKLIQNLDKLKNRPFFAFFDAWIYSILDQLLLQKAASLAYYLILSIFPFLIALLNILPHTPIGDVNIIAPLTQAFPEEISRILILFIRDIKVSNSSTLLSFSLVAGLWSASSALRQIIRNINFSYDFTKDRSFFSNLALSLGLTLGLIFLIILIFITQIFRDQVTQLINSIPSLKGQFYLAGRFSQLIIPLAYMFLSFFLLYYLCPRKEDRQNIPTQTFLPGAIFSTVSLVIFSQIFKFYISNFSSYAVTYGSLAGIIIFLLWLYLLGLIILLGGALNANVLRAKKGRLKWPRKESLIKNLIDPKP